MWAIPDAEVEGMHVYVSARHSTCPRPIVQCARWEEKADFTTEGTMSARALAGVWLVSRHMQVLSAPQSNSPKSLEMTPLNVMVVLPEDVFLGAAAVLVVVVVVVVGVHGQGSRQGAQRAGRTVFPRARLLTGGFSCSGITTTTCSANGARVSVQETTEEERKGETDSGRAPRSIPVEISKFDVNSSAV